MKTNNLTEAEKVKRLKALRLAKEAAEGKPAKQPGRVWSLTDELTFGKYRGEIVADVITSDEGHSWVKWAMENIDFTLDDQAMLEFESYDSPNAPPKAWESPRY